MICSWRTGNSVSRGAYFRLYLRLTIVRIANACMPFNLRRRRKAVSFDGFPGGCLNASAGSSFSQYSSSHSIGRSRSKLTMLCQQSQDKHYAVLTLRLVYSTPCRTQHSWICPASRAPYIANVNSDNTVCENATDQNALFSCSLSTDGVWLYIFLRWMPISCAHLRAIPTKSQAGPHPDVPLR